MSNSLYTAYYDSPLGMIAIDYDATDVHAILFANTWKGPQLNEAVLQPGVIAGTVAAICVQQLQEYFNGERTKFDFPFNQQGTPFQSSVWNSLLGIPFGKTISYLELSKRIGNAKAIRAVGTTNGKNQLCIVVPCHRVIGSNGSLVGYGGELWRKKWLLEHEAKFSKGVVRLGDW